MARKAKIVRKTTETDIRLEIDLDKTAGSSIEDHLFRFFNHMLELLRVKGF
jgi:imidazoleglycerol phosphate dehydratase HisB